MNKKRLSGGIVALGLAALVAVGGSLAWFTDNESKTNQFTTGKVDITLTEESKTGTSTDDGINYTNVMPGDTLDKKVIIHNVEQAAWVRLKVTVNGLSQADANKLVFIDNEGKEFKLEFDANNTAYITRDAAMAAKDANGEYVPFKAVKVPGKDWNNDYASKEFSIEVQAQAVQSDNNPDGFTGMTDADIIVAE